ncbi:MAG: hypothetical protein EAZ15_03755 [Sphingobacteriales bacterium]|nr:MAG: hypothetical protein EAZ15_03755 [Sphingobacteriales bacterium]
MVKHNQVNIYTTPNKLKFKSILMINKTQTYPVIIVGAGAAGIGMGVALKDFGINHFVILEEDVIGSSFKNWPQ